MNHDKDGTQTSFPLVDATTKKKRRRPWKRGERPLTHFRKSFFLN